TSDAFALRSPVLPNIASDRCTSYDHIKKLPDPDNKAGRGGVWNKTRQCSRIINRREGKQNGQKGGVNACNTPQVSWRCRSSGFRDNGRTGRRQGTGSDHHALAEYLAVKRYLPRVCKRLRKKGQRHDRWRSQDRGAAGRRRGARLPAARRGFQGRSRWWSRCAGLSLWQADGARAVGVRTRLRDGCQHAAGLAQIRRRQGASAKALLLDRRQRRLVPLRPDVYTATGLVQKTHYQAGRLQGP